MSLTSKLTDSNSILTITISGDFDFDLVKYFKKAYNKIESGDIKNIYIDLTEAVTIDSSALGIILAMQKDLNVEDENIKIINCSDVVRKIFRITSLDEKFIVS